MSAKVVGYYRELQQRYSELSASVVAIKALTKIIEESRANTMTEFTIELEQATQSLCEGMNKAVSVMAGCELFKRFVTRTAGDVTEQFDCFKHKLVERGRMFAENAPGARNRIAEMAYRFIRDGSTILLHSHSRAVMALVLRAANDNRRFTAYVTEARPTRKGRLAVQQLRQAGIPATLVLDSSVGFYMQRADMVLVGAEGVVENGGLVNQIGTYQIAILAKCANKPLYAVAESYKFVRLFPLNQEDLPSKISCKTLMDGKNSEIDDVLDSDHPAVDYTPPEYITLLFTDFGILTPSGVSDELIKLYY